MSGSGADILATVPSSGHSDRLDVRSEAIGVWGNLAARRFLVPLVLVRIQAPQPRAIETSSINSASMAR